MVKALQEETYRFFSSSSMKGVPRAVSSETLCLRGFWTAAVLSLLFFACYQVYTLLASYFDYAVVTSFYEQSVHPNGFMPTLPMITLCNRNPVPASVVYPEGVITQQEYLALVDEKIRCDRTKNCSASMLQKLHDVKEILKSPEGYFQYIGLEKARSIGHKQHDFIVSCKMHIFRGTESYLVPCTEHSDVRQYFVKGFFNCFDIDAKYNLLPDGGVNLGIEFILYLDNPKVFKPGSTLGKAQTSSGAVIMLTEQGITSASMMKIEGTNVSPGNDVIISVHPTWREREKHPYGECLNYSETDKVSKNHCFGACFDRFVKEDCKCHEPGTPVESETHHENASYCLSLHLAKEKIINNVICRDRSMKMRLEDCLDTCRLACHEIQYGIEVQTSTWPMPSNYATFYDQIIANKSYESSFSELKDVLEGNCAGDLDCEMKFSRASRKIQANFAKVSCHLTDHKFFLLKDVRKIVVSELLSQLGGTLNLWSGITVVVVLEVCEWIYRLLYRVIKSDINHRTRTPDNQNDSISATVKIHCATCRCC